MCLVPGEPIRRPLIAQELNRLALEARDLIDGATQAIDGGCEGLDLFVQACDLMALELDLCFCTTLSRARGLGALLCRGGIGGEVGQVQQVRWTVSVSLAVLYPVQERRHRAL